MKKKNTFIRVLALSLCAIVLCLSLASCTAGDKIKTGASDAWGKVKDGAEDIYNKVTNKPAADIDMTFDNGAMVSLCADVLATESSDPAAISQKRLVATVLPTSAADKTVDWSIYWITKPETAADDVTEYATIVPDSDGSASAVFSLYQFVMGAEIGVKVKTRTGGYTAECVVHCYGKPTSGELRWETASGDHGIFVDEYIDQSPYASRETVLKVYYDLLCDYNPDGKKVGDRYSDYEFTLDGLRGSITLLGPDGELYTFDVNDAKNRSLSQLFTHGFSHTAGDDHMVLVLECENGSVFSGLTYTDDDGATYKTGDFTFGDGCNLSGVEIYVSVVEKVSGISESFVITFANPVNTIAVDLDTTEIVY